MLHGDPGTTYPSIMKKNSKQNKNKKNGKRQDQLPGLTKNSLTVVPRSSGLVVPDRMYTKLRFYGTNAVTMAVATTHFAVRWRPTGAFDIEPNLGGITLPGFNEFAAFYGAYRVTSSRARFQLTQNGQSSLTAVMLPLNLDPTAAPSFATVAGWVMNPYAKHKFISNNGGPITTLVGTMSTEKIFGSDMIYFDDNFQSAVTTVPANNWFWALGVIASPSITGATLVNYLVDIDIGIEFFDRKALQQ